MKSSALHTLSFPFLVLAHFLMLQSAGQAKQSQKDDLEYSQKIIEDVKKDDQNQSFTSMIDNIVMKKHTLSTQKGNQPYFNTDDRFVLSEIVSMVLERPDYVINDVDETGRLQIVREFSFTKQIYPLFIKAKHILKESRGNYLGVAMNGTPSNVVMVEIEVSERAEDGRLKDHPATAQNIRFVKAFPIEKQDLP